MEFDFLEPVSIEITNFVKQLTTQNLGSKVVFHTAEDFPDIEKVKLGIIGVLENRGSSQNFNEVDLTHIRKELYSMYPGNWDASIADFGDILPGNSLDDTYFAVQSIISLMLKKNIIPIIIGGTQDITYAMYRAYDNLDQMVNLLSVDQKFDLGKQENGITKDSFLSKIIVEEPNNLFNYSNVGFQTYYNSQEEIDLIDKLFFDAYRLGEVCNNITLSEPVFRDADIVSIDMTSVKSADSSNTFQFIPNGFNGKEICSLSRYAGISDKVTSFGIFNHFNTKNESTLIAQILWYFIEGVNYRSNEYPFGSKNDFIKYIVPFENEEIIFFKSNKSERWWIEIPFFSTSNNKLKKNTLLPCSHEDYLEACNNEFPDRWWKAQKKNML